MIYIYSFLEGETKWSADAPTDCDLVAVADGQLSVLRVQTFLDSDTKQPTAKVDEVDGDGTWSAATEAEYVMTHGEEWHE